jgi:FKBP-type peptidyl-prolyl cis-trans isomerase SlpA
MSDIIQPDSYLTLHYRLALMNVHNAVSNGAAKAGNSIEIEPGKGDVINTFGGKPATLQMGGGQFAPALEEKLLGLKTGDHTRFELEPDAGFGPRNPELIQKVSRSLLDAESESHADYQPGDVVEFNAPGGSRMAGVLKELNAQYALFDFNHPLAGQPLCFEVQIIGVL